MNVIFDWFIGFLVPLVEHMSFIRFIGLADEVVVEGIENVIQFDFLLVAFHCTQSILPDQEYVEKVFFYSLVRH